MQCARKVPERWPDAEVAEPRGEGHQEPDRAIVRCFIRFGAVGGTEVQAGGAVSMHSENEPVADRSVNDLRDMVILKCNQAIKLIHKLVFT